MNGLAREIIYLLFKGEESENLRGILHAKCEMKWTGERKLRQADKEGNHITQNQW